MCCTAIIILVGIAERDSGTLELAEFLESGDRIANLLRAFIVFNNYVSICARVSVNIDHSKVAFISLVVIGPILT